jgi:hypothetical protein
MKIYTIRDTVTEKISPLNVHENDKAAQRAFYQAMKTVDEDSRGDYTLICLGEINTNTGEIKAWNPELVASMGTKN